MNYYEESLKLHEKLSWKIETTSKMSLNSREDLSLAYTPWVAASCLKIKDNKDDVYKYTLKANTVAVISDWSAVLWLGNIGPEAGLPVMEWKCILFKEFWWVNAFPIILGTQDTEEIINTVKAISPTFWWINLEDISAPRCFEIEERLKKELDIPVFHDDQHWTAIVVLAWLINAMKITWKKKEELKVVINGFWAAWVAILKLLHLYWVKNIIACDSKWIISKDRTDLNSTKIELLKIINLENKNWTIHDALIWADVFIWVSVANAISKEDIESMNKDAIVFAMANPTPEIMPDIAKSWWAKIIATWRSDFPNQVNNVLVFPWIFKWALKYRISKITDEIKMNAALALANYVQNPTEDNIIPNPLDKNVANIIAESLIKE